MKIFKHALTNVSASTRFLPLFKGLCYTSLLVVPTLLLPTVLSGDWLAIQTLVAWTAVVVSALLGMRKLRTVIWEDNQLRVKDQQTILLLPEEIKNIELKMLIGVHEVTLCEPHPYLGKSFLFQASMKYFFKHDATDDQMEALRQHIARSGREEQTEAFVPSPRSVSPPPLGGA